MLWELVLGFYIAAAISVIAWWRRALDMSGAAAAIVAGTIIFGLGGWGPSIALMFFFVSGSMLSALPKRRPSLLIEEVSGRTWKQVLANGLIPVIAILASRLVPGKESLCILTYYGALAASCSDSWGTEVGIRFGRNVREITTGNSFLAGLSGGITIVGIAASVAGAAIVALPVLIPSQNTSNVHPAIAITGIICAGILGSVSDSILGSTVQGKFRSQSGQISESNGENNDKNARFKLDSGFKHIGNNTVNFLSSALGALFLLLIFSI